MIDLDVEIERTRRAIVVAREIAERAASNPLKLRKWLPGQFAFLNSARKRKLFRSGSQAQGKTEAGAAETVYRLLGSHPFREVRPAPVRGWVVCGGGQQSSIVQERIWNLVPKDMVADGFAYDPQKGAFLGKYPRLMLKNGSLLEVRSGGQDGLNLASATLDFCWFDEPPESERVYNELLKRIMRTNGDIYGTLTALFRKVDYLEALCRKEVIEDIHFDMRPEHFIFVGTNEVIKLSDGTPCDEDWIAQQREETPPHEAPVTLDGEWEFRVGGAYFDGAWDPSRMVYPAVADKADKWLLGIDHGDRPGKQRVYLMTIDDTGEFPRVHVHDEYHDPTGQALPLDDARGVLAMLARNGVAWHQLYRAGGDRAHLPGTGRQKSNKDLAAQVAKLLKIPLHQLRPKIETAEKGPNSVRYGVRWLYHVMVRGHFSVDPRCALLIGELGKYVLSWRDEDKDGVDALRMGLEPWIRGGVRRSGSAPTVRLWGRG